MILRVFPSGPLGTNAILLACNGTKSAAVIDPAPSSAPLILQKSSELGLTLQKILLTHSHWDHIADIAPLQERMHLPVYVHVLDRENLLSPGSDRIPLLIPIEPVVPDHLIEDGQQIEIGDLTLQVIHTPGHSPGGVCYYLKAQNILFSGDTLFAGTIGNLQLPTAEAEKMWISLRKLAALPLQTRVIPGHGGETTLARENWLSQAEKLFGN